MMGWIAMGFFIGGALGMFLASLLASARIADLEAEVGRLRQALRRIAGLPPGRWAYDPDGYPVHWLP